MRFCSKCGSHNADGVKFCMNCGNSLEQPKKDFFSAAGSLGDDLSGPSAPAPTPRPVAPAPAPVAPPRPVAPAPAPAVPPRPVPPRPVPPAPAPTPKPAPMPHTAPASAGRPARRRISPMKELKLLLRQGILILVGDKRNLIISLVFPFIAALITVWIGGKDMFINSEATKSGCFILVCAAIWGGLFNSIQSLVKERDNIKRDYVSGALRIECYMGSRAIIQFVLCLFQSMVLAMSIPAVEWVHGNDMPTKGVLGGPAFMEYYISLFLIMYAADALGLLISSIVKKEELASKLAPYILIAQLLFSGVLFDLEGGGKLLSGMMISRWGMEALGSISNLNKLPTTIYNEVSGGEACPACGNKLLESLHFPEKNDMFNATEGHFIGVIFIMLLFIVVPLIAGNIMLHRVKKDGRD